MGLQGEWAPNWCSGLVTEQQHLISKLLSFPLPREPQTLPVAIPYCSISGKASDAAVVPAVPGTEGISTAHPPNAGISQPCTSVVPRAVPWQDPGGPSDRGTASGDGTTSSKCHSERLEGIPGAQILDRGKLFSVTLLHTYLFVFAFWK